MFGDNLTALPTLLWIGEHPFWTLLTLSLMLVHFWRRPGERRELLSELGFVMMSIVVIVLIQLEGGWFKLPLPHHLLVEISTLLAGLVMVKIWGILLFEFLLPLCHVKIPRIIADIVITIGYIGWGLFRLYASGMALGEIVTTSAVITAVIAFAMQDTSATCWQVSRYSSIAPSPSATGCRWTPPRGVSSRSTGAPLPSRPATGRQWSSPTVTCSSSVSLCSAVAVANRSSGDAGSGSI